MAENSKIEWTNHTFNHVIGCAHALYTGADGKEHAHQGCLNCYAEAFTSRYGRVAWGTSGARSRTSDDYWRQPLKWNRQAEKAGERHRVFCASLADVFEDWQGPIVDTYGNELCVCQQCDTVMYYQQPDCKCRNERVPRKLTMDDLRRHLFQLIDQTPHLDWLLLTKRPQNVRRMWVDPLPFGSYATVAEEVVLPVPGFDGYHVSNLGVVYTENGSTTCLRCGVALNGHARKKYCSAACRQVMWRAGATAVLKNAMRSLSPDEGEDGHQRVTLYRDGEPTRELVHRLVLSVFVRDPEEDEQGCHRDGNPRNNRLDNLRWGTQSSNWQDSKAHGTHRRYSKLSEADVRSIRASSEPVAAMAAAYGVSDTQIRNIKAERQWATHSGLYRRNVFLGTSVSDQASADAAVPELIKLHDLAPVLFLSVEPLLGQVNLKPWLGGSTNYHLRLDVHGALRNGDFAGFTHDDGRPMSRAEAKRELELLRFKGVRFIPLGDCDDLDPETGCHGHRKPGIGWVICGGESGHGARPMHPDWARSLRDQCQESGVPFFFKQWGEYLHAHPKELHLSKGPVVDFQDVKLQRVGKKAAGRLLDGKEWSEFPCVSRA